MSTLKGDRHKKIFHKIIKIDVGLKSVEINALCVWTSVFTSMEKQITICTVAITIIHFDFGQYIQSSFLIFII
jgi:hypothetical protein